MTRTFEQAIAEAQKQFTENCQAIVEQYRKYPDGFTYISGGGWQAIVLSAETYIHGDSDWNELYHVGLLYKVETPRLSSKGKPVIHSVIEGEIDEAIAQVDQTQEPRRS